MNRQNLYQCLLVLFLTLTFLNHNNVYGKEIAGLVENVYLFPESINFHAKLDTGAKTSSLHATNIKILNESGKSVVQFTVTTRDKRKVILKRPLVRISTIKRHINKDQSRPVVKLLVCIGHVQKQVEVNLVNRSRFVYQMLVGRNLLANHFLVDSGKSYILENTCFE